MVIYRMQKLATLIASIIVVLSASAQEVIGDVVTTIADEGESGMYVATLCPMKDVAVDKDEAELFSIYTDSGRAILMKMRVRDGKFIVKAGDCVIIKTLEAKAVPLMETKSSRSSVWINDLFCPSENMSVEDFCSSHAVAEGECIYLLTNLPANGGFGFTKFAGDKLKKGYFYIVTTDYSQEIINDSEEVHQDSEESTLAGTRAALDIEDGDFVPFLEGDAGNDDGFMTPVLSLFRGDANADGEVDIRDVEAVSAHIVGTSTGTFHKVAADVNADNKINAVDIVGLVDIIKAKTD